MDGLQKRGYKQGNGLIILLMNGQGSTIENDLPCRERRRCATLTVITGKLVSFANHYSCQLRDDRLLRIARM